MPTYRFQCNACGLSFTARAGAEVLEYKCDCGKVAKRTLPQGIHVSVSGNVQGLGPPTTGLSGVDYNFDRAVGESSRKNWQGIAARQRDKLDVISANKGATGFDLSKQADGSYRVMAPEERAASERSREFHFKVLDAHPILKKVPFK